MVPTEEIKNRLDVADVIGGYVKLEKAGVNYRARCPFHNEKTPSFFVSPSRQIWRCFGGCSEGGDMFKFIMKIEGLEFRDALRLLAEKAGVKLEKQDPKLISERSTLFDINEEAAGFYEQNLESEEGTRARVYLKERGLTDASIKKFRLGFAPDSWRALSTHLIQLGYKLNDIEKAGLVIKKTTGARPETAENYYDRFRSRIMFPITDTNGRVVGLTGRILEDRKTEAETTNKETDSAPPAKYMNSPETAIYEKGTILYGLDRAKMEIKKRDACVLVEGNLDLIMSHQVGVTHVVATSGTALTDRQLRIIKRYTNNLSISFDMDEGGENATKRGIDLALRQGFTIKVIRIPDAKPGTGRYLAKDPAEYIKMHPGEWEKHLGEAESIFEFYLESAFGKFKGESAEWKKKIATLLLPELKKIPHKIEQAHWIAELAARLKVSEEDVRNELERISAPPSVKKEAFPLSPTRERKKARKDLLEERLLFILLNHPQKLVWAKESNAPLSREGEEAIRYLESETNDPSRLSPEVKELIDSLSLYSIYEESEEIDYDEEADYIVKELKSLLLKEELTRLSFDIQEAERNGNEKVATKLLKKFQAMSTGLYV